MKHLVLSAAAFTMSAATVLAIPATAAHAQSRLSGTYVNDDNSAKWVFADRTGQFYQYKSINGNPGTIVTDFSYELVDDGKTFNYIQTEIRLEDHPMGERKQKLNKPSTEPVQIRTNAFVIGGKIYTKK